MKKGTLISIILIILGFIFECIYYTIDNPFLNVKFGVLGVICLVAGVLGLWLNSISVADEEKKS